MAHLQLNKESLNSSICYEESVVISQIKPNSRNVRTHSAQQIRQIANSIVAFGFTNPLLVSENLELIAGHGRYEAAKLLGLSEVPVIVISGLSPAKKRALAIADNKLAQNSKWNREKLAIEIPELAELLHTEGLDVEVLGFSQVEIGEFQIDFPELTADAQDRIDSAWCKTLPVCKSGDFWELDTHKLLCGDPHSVRDLARLMGGDCADLVLVDPLPNRLMPSPNSLSSVFNAAASVSRKGAFHFVDLGPAHIAEIMVEAKPIYGEPIDIIAWIKPKAAPGSYYRSQHELVGVFCLGQDPRIEPSHKACSRSNVWRCAHINPIRIGNYQCSTKPVSLIADAIKDCTQKGDVVLDIFSGAGSAILAADRTGRHARAVEIKPELVDLAIRRWQACTGKIAIHADTRLTFNNIAAASARASTTQPTSGER